MEAEHSTTTQDAHPVPAGGEQAVLGPGNVVFNQQMKTSVADSISLAVVQVGFDDYTRVFGMFFSLQPEHGGPIWEQIPPELHWPWKRGGVRHLKQWVHKVIDTMGVQPMSQILLKLWEREASSKFKDTYRGAAFQSRIGDVPIPRVPPAFAGRDVQPVYDIDVVTLPREWTIPYRYVRESTPGFRLVASSPRIRNVMLGRSTEDFEQSVETLNAHLSLREYTRLFLKGSTTGLPISEETNLVMYREGMEREWSQVLDRMVEYVKGHLRHEFEEGFFEYMLTLPSPARAQDGTVVTTPCRSTKCDHGDYADLAEMLNKSLKFGQHIRCLVCRKQVHLCQLYTFEDGLPPALGR